jgi:hypothetical protein
MHMKSAPHLLLEDRPEFERVLDEALRTAHRRTDLAAIGERLNTEQLRTMALSAATAIAACAATEYERFVRLREDARRPVPLPDPDRGTQNGSPAEVAEQADDRGGVGGLAGAVGEGFAEASGAGLIAIVSVLTPVLAGTAAAIFLVLGYLLHMVSPEPAVAEPMRNIGWVFAMLALAGVVIAMTGLLIAALRNGASSIRAPRGGHDDTAGQDGFASELAEARSAWREALLERGIVPFLREALAGPQGPGQAPVAYVPNDAGEEERHRTPRLGYSHPDFSSHTASETETSRERTLRPRFTSPDFTSPDYGGPEHRPE